MTLPFPPLAPCGVPMSVCLTKRHTLKGQSSEAVRLVGAANEVSWEMQVRKQA